MAKKSSKEIEFEKINNLSNINTSDLKILDVENNFSVSVVGKTTKNSTEIIKRFLRNKIALIGLIVFIGIVLATIIFPLISSYNSTDPIYGIDNSLIVNLPPSWVQNGEVTRLFNSTLKSTLDQLNVNYKIVNNGEMISIVYSLYGQSISGINSFVFNSFSWLGTDGQGRDIWTRLWVGTRESLKLALFVTVVETLIGVSVGAIIGFHAGSKFDTISMRIVEIINSIPSLIWFILILFILPPGFWSMFAAFVLVGWLRPVATTRMYVLRVKDAEYIKAAESIGVSKMGRIFDHALMNVIGKIMIIFVQRIPMIIFAEATIAFLGLAADPSAATLGNLINDAKGQIESWWYIMAPTLTLLLITVSLQVIALGLHDAFDPKAGK